MDLNKTENYSIKGIREQFKQRGVFYTPPELAKYLQTFIPENLEYKEVYDPTCGHGGLFQGLNENIIKYGEDINEIAINYCKENIKNFIGTCGDVLKAPAYLDKKFKVILGNPPFSIKWEPVTSEDVRFKEVPTIPTKGKADWAFLVHILHVLDDEGVAIVLNFPGILYRGNREGKIRQWFVEKNYIDTIVAIPPNSFEDTSVATALLVIKKNKTTTDIKFIDKELNIERVVSFEEIKENNFNLSVHQYIQKEEIDIMALHFAILERDVVGLTRAFKLDEVCYSIDALIHPLFKITILKEIIQMFYNKYPKELQEDAKKATEGILNNFLYGFEKLYDYIHEEVEFWN